MVGKSWFWKQDHTYGPLSEGVTGSEGGGGRFIKVGALEDILEYFQTQYTLTAVFRP